MPAQKRSQETSPPPLPPPQPPPSSPPPPQQQQPPPPPPPEEKDDDSLQRNQNDNGEHADDGGDSDGSASSSGGEKDEFVFVKLSEIRKEVQCPICLGIIRKTRTVMECLHRFCRECIDKSMRLGNNECPACRTHCASRRSLRDDPNYDALIAALYPDIDKYEEEQELAFHEEEKARNKQIQASIAQTFRRQSEALGRKRSARAAAAAGMRRSHGNYRNVRGRRNTRTSEHQGSDEDDDANGNYGGKDSSSADERSPEVKFKRYKRWGGTRFSQSSAAANSDAGYDENESELNRELLGASAGLVGSSEILAWGKGGMRSHGRHGGFSGSNGKFARNSRLSKLMDCLRCSDLKNEELDVSLELVAMDKEEIPNVQRPYLSCKPTLSVRHLCQYVALQTSMQADEIEIWWKKELKERFPSEHDSEPLAASAFLDQFKSDTQKLEEHQTLGEIRTLFSSSQCNLVLAYRRK